MTKFYFRLTDINEFTRPSDLMNHIFKTSKKVSEDIEIEITAYETTDVTPDTIYYTAATEKVDIGYSELSFLIKSGLYKIKED